MNRAVFLDRDDTLIDNSGFLADPDDVRLVPGAAQAVRRFREAGYHVVVVTNQSGVARGYFTEDQLVAVHQRMQDLLHAEGTGIDALYYCPYLETDEAVVPEYRMDSHLRKPRPGMLFLAANDLGIDLARSWMIGDAERDVQAGRAAGCRTIRLRLPPGEETSADHRAETLDEAVDIVLNRVHAAEPVLAAATTVVAPADSHRPANLAADSRVWTPPPAVVTRPHAAHDSHAPSAHAATVAHVGAVHSPAASANSAPAVEPATPVASSPPPAAAPLPSDADTRRLLEQILDELRGARRDAVREEFSVARLAGAITAAFAICLLGWGLFAAVDAGSDPTAAENAVTRLLAAIAFQLISLTCIASARR